jgi:hypothetical protein
MVNCGSAAASLAVQAVADSEPLALAASCLLATGTYQSWRQTNGFDPRYWRAYLGTLSGLLVSAAAVSVSIFNVVTSPQAALLTPMLRAQIAGLIYALITTSIWIALALVTQWSFLRLRLFPYPWRARQLLIRINAFRGPRATAALCGRRRQAGRGWLYVAAAAVLLFLCLLVSPDWIADRWLSNQVNAARMATKLANQVSGLLELFGFVLLVRAQPYFAPSAEAVLAADSRPPILLLRPFTLDERDTDFTLSVAAVFDFSLETRLTSHFDRYGPFIAVGAPQDELPIPGAARARLSEDAWQTQVVSWIVRAQLIVLLFGPSPWIAWELSKVIERGRTSDLIILFPRPRTFLKRLFWPFYARKERTALLAILRNHLQLTPWAEALNAVQHPEHLCAMLLRADGSLVLIESRCARVRDPYHLAAVIGHGLIVAPDDPDATTENLRSAQRVHSQSRRSA